MLTEAIKNFPKQLEFEPKIENAEKLIAAKKFVVAGMGGSHLAADFLKVWKPKLDLTVHSDYGLPPLPDKALKSSLLIASSYSGNTEETIDAFQTAAAKKISAAVIATGGKLLELARKHNAPYIQLPDTGIQPRSAAGFSAVALLKIMGEEQALAELKALAKRFDPNSAEAEGKKLAEELRGFVPIIYSSTQNQPIAFNWKIRFNETGKIPAFANVFPELNHNEINAFDPAETTRQLTQKFFFIFLRDNDDHPRVKARMSVLEKMYGERKLPVRVIALEGQSVWEKIFSSLLLADWAAYYTAVGYGLDPEAVKLAEEFKKLIASADPE